MSRKDLFLLGLLWLLSSMLFADGNRFIHYRSVDGLSFNNVDHLAEDDEGYIYASTLFGLNIFDGSTFKVFNQNNTPYFSNKVTCVLPFSKGFVLIATLDKGLFLYNKFKEKISPIKTSSNELELLVSITVIALDANENIWIGCEKGELYFTPLTKSAYPSESSLHYKLTKVAQLTGPVHAIECVGDDVFIGDDSPFITRVKNRSSKFIVDHPLEIPSSVKTYAFSSYNDTLLIGTDKGLFMHENINKLEISSAISLNTPWQLGGKVIRSISSNHKTDWVGTEGSGLYKISRKGGDYKVENFTYSQKKKNSINSNYVLSTLVDKTNNLWIGTWFGGMNRLDLKEDVYSFIYDENENNIFANITWCITKEEAGSFWIGTHGNGLCKYTVGKKNFSSIVHDNETQSISSIYYNKEVKVLFVGTWGKGVQVYDTKEMNRLRNLEAVFSPLQNDRIYAITPDKFGNLWIGSFQNGLFHYNSIQNSLTNVELLTDGEAKQPDIRSLLYDPADNVLWVGSIQKGLFKLTLSAEGFIAGGRQLNSFKISEEDVSVESLYLDVSGNLWILLRDGVIVKFKGKDIDTPNRIEQLEGLITTGIVEDNAQNIWISTYHGLHLIDKKTNQAESFLTEYAFHDVVFDSVNKTIIAASDNGLVQVNPYLELNKQTYPAILLSELKVFDKVVYPDTKFRGKTILKNRLNYSDTIVLPHLAHTFSIRLNALSFSDTQKEKISFQLKGFEKIWNEQVGSSVVASYTNVPPGTYILAVKTANKYNNWNPNTRELTIIKQGPWWSSNLAKAIYALLLIVIVYLIYRALRIRIIIKEELKFEKLRLSQEHELYQQKLSFFTNISHDVRTPLTLMLGPLEEIGSSEEIPEKHRSKITRIIRHTKMLHNLFNQILDFRKMETDNLSVRLRQINLNKFAQYIFAQFNDLAVSKKIDFELICAEENVVIVSDPQKLESIFFNLISNAIKFTPSYGQIFLEILTDNDTIIIVVKDTGIGIPENELNTIFTRFYRTTQNDSISKGTGIGLALVKSYVELLNGRISVKSTPNKETTFTITLPLRSDYNDFEIYEPEYHEIEETASSSHSHISTQNTADTKKKRDIVIIDDNIDILDYLVEILSPYYNVYTASNGVEGIQLTVHHQPSLVICDIMMEGMDGIEVTERIKTDLNISHIPIILLTAKSAIDAKIEGYEKGADAYIEKPFNKTLLLTRIKKLIEHRQLLKKKFMVFDSTIDNVTPTSLDEKFLKTVVTIIEKNIKDSDFAVQNLVDEMNTTQDQLYRKIKALTGLSINHFIRSVRLKKAAQLLSEGNMNVGEVMFNIGFNNPSYFTRCFKAEFGVTPSKFMESKKGESL